MMRWAVMALAASLPLGPALAQNGPLLLESPHGTLALSLFDIADIALSESGEITDVFITLMLGAEAQLGALKLLQGERVSASICGLNFESAPLRPPITGHLYLVQTTMLRGAALQALWQGQARCDTLAPEVFADDN